VAFFHETVTIQLKLKQEKTMKNLLLGLIISTILLGTSFAADPFYQDKGKYLILTGNESTSFVIKKDLRAIKLEGLTIHLNTQSGSLSVTIDHYQEWKAAKNALIKIVIANANK
jgi:hypothetical protein